MIHKSRPVQLNTGITPHFFGADFFFVQSELSMRIELITCSFLARPPFYTPWKHWNIGLSKICERQPVKNLKWYDLPKQTKRDHMSSNFLKALSSTNFMWSILEYLNLWIMGFCDLTFKYSYKMTVGKGNLFLHV